MNSNNFPLISIGLPVYNGEAQIERALNSLRSQAYTNIEIVISDNASTDNTREICERYCSIDNRVSYVRQSRNIGPTANFEMVLNLSNGYYFMWLGHDDWLSDNYIQECVAVLRNRPDVSLVCGKALYYKFGQVLYAGADIQLIQASPTKRVEAFFAAVTDNGTFYGLMRRNQLLKVKIKNVMGGDWLIVASMAFMGKIIILPSITINRELGNTSASCENIAKVLGLPDIQIIFPHVVIAIVAFKDIAWADSIYSLNRFNRFCLAWKCQRIIRVRNNSAIVSITRKCFFIVKTYLKNYITNMFFKLV